VNFLPRRRRKPEIIIVSLIDIFAILLIFMVMTTQFKQEQPEVTIKLHLSAIFRKMGVRSRTEAAMQASRAGFL